MPSFSETYEPPTNGAPTSGLSDAARPQGLGRIRINYLRLTSPTPRERSLTSPRLGQPIGAEGHQRSGFLAPVFSGAAVAMSSEEWERQMHLDTVEEGMAILLRGKSGSQPRIYRHPD